MINAQLIARIQFAFTISFHLLFPAFTIGLASWLAMLEFLWLRSRRPAYMSLYRFWVEILALSFGLGVVSGIVMSFHLARSSWVTQLDNEIAARWFSVPNFYWLSQVPFATALVGYFHWRATPSQAQLAPFVPTIALIAPGYAGLAISLWPNIVPHANSYSASAAPVMSQGFLLVGVAITLPAVLFDNAYSYYVFRGKVRAADY